MKVLALLVESTVSVSSAITDLNGKLLVIDLFTTTKMFLISNRK